MVGRADGAGCGYPALLKNQKSLGLHESNRLQMYIERGNPMNMTKMLKQAQKMQAQMLATQAEIKASSVTGVAGNGLVTVIVAGSHKVESIKIKRSAVDPEDVELLEGLLVTALNNAVGQIEALSGSVLKDVSGSSLLAGL